MRTYSRRVQWRIPDHRKPQCNLQTKQLGFLPNNTDGYQSRYAPNVAQKVAFPNRSRSVRNVIIAMPICTATTRTLFQIGRAVRCARHFSSVICSVPNRFATESIMITHHGDSNGRFIKFQTDLFSPRDRLGTLVICPFFRSDVAVKPPPKPGFCRTPVKSP